MHLLSLLLPFLALPLSSASQHPLTSKSFSQNVDLSEENTELFSLHRSLCDISSLSGNESYVGDFLVSYLESLNFTVETQSVPPLPRTPANTTRRNIFAYPSRFYRNTKILLTSHIDTVPPYIPYSTSPLPSSSSYNSNDFLINGRGTNDAKGSVAAQIIALTSLLSDPNDPIAPCDASLLFVVGEEVSGDGMKTFSSLLDVPPVPRIPPSDPLPTTTSISGCSLPWPSLPPSSQTANPTSTSNSKPYLSYDAVIFGEPTELKLARGHKGIMFFDVLAHGKAAHSGYPWLGKSAIEMLGPAAQALKKLEAHLPSSKRYGNSTLNIGTISGGEARNVVPARGKMEVAIRLGGGTKDSVAQMVKSTIEGLGEEGLELVIGEGGYGPVECDADIEGFEGVGVNYGTDVPNLRGEHRRYLYGPGSILSAHGDDEGVKASDLVSAVEGYKALVRGALEKGKREGEEGVGEGKGKGGEL
ncbi:hypothetical protein MMC10_008729 [Thelotrema lepadinum]|nr:hypothetical protein [Thelotrema lepadinum]